MSAVLLKNSSLSYKTCSFQNALSTKMARKVDQPPTLCKHQQLMEVIEVARGNQSMVVLGSRWPCPGTATSFTLLRSLVLFFFIVIFDALLRGCSLHLYLCYPSWAFIAHFQGRSYQLSICIIFLLLAVLPLEESLRPQLATLRSPLILCGYWTVALWPLVYALVFFPLLAIPYCKF